MGISGTITYTVKSGIKSDFYDLTVLTVTPTINPGTHKCKIGNTEGAASHVLLKYKTGGHLLTSMGHWIELMKIDTSEKKLFEVAEKTYGVNRATEMKMEYAQLNPMEQQAYLSKNSTTMVPCSNNFYSKGFN